eukprot:2812766-Pyramimonas_sp.AAC.1
MDALESSIPASARSASGASVDTTTQSKLADLEREIALLRQSGKASMYGNAVTDTIVFGNLDALGSLAEATKFLKQELDKLTVPAPADIYMKGEVFSGIVFAKMNSDADREKALN